MVPQSQLPTHIPAASSSTCVRTTARLRKQCQKASDGITHPKLPVEGPYGEKSDLHQFDTVLLFVGGTGIASAVPYILDHIQRKLQNMTRTTDIQLVWSGRQKAMFDHIAATDLREALQRNDIHASFFVTVRAPVTTASTIILDSEKVNEKSTGSAPGTSSPDSVSSVQPPTALATTYGRPDVRAIIASTIEQAKISSTRVAVLVCGPAQMADGSRDAVFTAMRGGFHGIEYFEETFGW
ncbi:hypothetical protein SEUCBS139899_007869 [Sporothrix eucalyptigena]